MIEFIAVSKKYTHTLAVQDFSCTILEKKVTGLLGVNGAGKTSVLKALAGIHFPTGGEIRIQGISIEENDIEIKTKIGYVSENPLFYQNLTVKELLQFTANIHFPEKLQSEKMQNILHVAEKTALSEILHKKIKELSRGFRQRLAFAQALIHDPAILILDEPTSALDPVQINEIRKLIQTSKKTKTIILSSHIMQEIEALCDEVIIMHEGRILAKGSISAILEQTKKATLEKAFLFLIEGANEK